MNRTHKLNPFWRNSRLEKHFPSTINDQTLYISTGDPELFFNQTSLYKPGELGKKFTYNNKRYQIVQLDASSNSTVANGLVFWASRTAYKVTARVADASNVAVQNGVAGRCPGITAAGNYFAMQIGGAAVVVYGGNNTNGAVASAAIAKSASTASDADAVAAGTAPTNKVVGWIITAGTTTNTTAGVSLTLDDGEVQ